MNIWHTIGFIASITGAVSLVPEVIKAFKNHHLNDIAWAMLLLFLSSSTLWMTYGILTANYPLILSAMVNTVMEFILIHLKRKYEVEGQRRQLPSNLFAE